jgi:hypothetical protein
MTAALWAGGTAADCGWQGGRRSSCAGARGCGGTVLLELEVLGASARAGPDLGHEGWLWARSPAFLAMWAAGIRRCGECGAAWAWAAVVCGRRGHACTWPSARKWTGAASAEIGVTVAWNHGGFRPRAVLLYSLAAWSLAGHGG